MTEQSTKSYSLSVDDPAALAATLKEVLELAFTRINRLEFMVTGMPAIVCSVIEAAEASPKFARLRGSVSIGLMLRAAHDVCAPMAQAYLATGKFPDAEAIKPKLVLAALDGVRVDSIPDR